MFEAIIFVLILFVFIATFIFWCCEKKRDLDTRIIGGAFIAYSFISVFAQLYLSPILAINEWDKRLSLQIQFTALVIGLTAAIIAFRNYQRKSGQDIYYAFFEHIKIDLPHICTIILYNNKDRTTVVFAVDVVMSDGSRIRLFQDDLNPTIIPAYSSVVIHLDYTSKYTDDFIPDKFKSSKMKFLCITMNGEILAQFADMDMLRNDFRNTCIVPQTTSNAPESYENISVPHKATHWITLISSYYVDNDDENIDHEHITITGYYEKDVLYIIPEPEKDNYLGNYLHKKTQNQVQEIEEEDDYKYYNGYFDHYAGVGLMSIEKIQFTKVTKQKSST